MDAMRENGLYDEDKFGVTLRIAEVTDRYRNATRRYVCTHNMTVPDTCIVIGDIWHESY